MTSKENFEIIYKEYAPTIRKLCLSYTGDRDSAEDLIQETFITVWMKIDSFRNDAKLSTWIYRIAINNCLMNLRKKKHVEKISDRTFIEIPEETSDEKVQQIDLLYTCISKLKEADRVLITLVMDEKPYEEIAEITGITENNLRVKIHRIKKELTEIFHKYARL
ncbi:RNA polymerase sigma factor [Sphingobacterium sp. 2149]|uniref:RNA polymerase sigma factor n=1 Tax=Sphingobacterium sp. 2149 TaxID=2817763 RepID=UPI001AE6BC23|nr:sigma-70 family RNA polymerase sigma factor [Sphingobacterium sp. 2149]MDR6737385.1 RNA polymerase sigma-70 factor (ECF subfamily) [Sphingobacterium sp. 2149]